MKQFGKLEHKQDGPILDKHQVMLRAIEPWAKPQVQKNLTPVVVKAATRRTKLLLMLLPEWAHKFPPYNLARIGSVTRAAGYETHIWDLNAEAHRSYTQGWPGLDYDPWDGMRDWHWLAPQYFTDLHQHMLPLLESTLERIEALQPNIIGFTIYYCNLAPTRWLSQQIKARWPHIKIVVGGSSTHYSYYQPEPEYDYVVNGEGESLLLGLLDDIEQGITHHTPLILRQNDRERIDLDKLPLPDYSFFDLSLYDIPNGVNSELSRGCTAKCTFCEETHFYLYRQRQAGSILREVSHLYDNHGIDAFWFIDSLVNGNIRELRAFCKGIIASGMQIHWTGYARCDGRMDLDYYKDLAASGCVALNYGCESGSQRVLDAMDKGVTVAEMEQNFRDGAAAGVEAYTNWIVAYPAERYCDFADTMTMIWRNRNHNITVISPGQGYNVGVDSIVGQNLLGHDLMSEYYLGMWISKDFKMSKLNRFIRVKTFNIFLDHLITRTPIAKGTRPNLSRCYSIEFTDPDRYLDISYETFDYDIICTDQGPVADSVINEIWPLLRMLWRTRGGYTAEIQFDPQEDLREFGDNVACPITAVYKFSITDRGDWSADFAISYQQPPFTPGIPHKTPDQPWCAIDFGRNNSNSALRARRLARPDLDDLHRAFTEDDDHRLQQQHAELSQLDLSFAYSWAAQGTWDKQRQRRGVFGAMLAVELSTAGDTGAQ
jgi:anaerobic magnesium-protoporphyrin IX monomethyl ester cyclase